MPFDRSIIGDLESGRLLPFDRIPTHYDRFPTADRFLREIIRKHEGYVSAILEILKLCNTFLRPVSSNYNAEKYLEI